MKSIFTYPNNSGTNYIDPRYDGDDTVGYQKRIKELKDGTYKTHLNSTTITSTVSELMQAHAKYNNHSALEEISGNNTIYKFWEQPILQGSTELIESDILNASAVHQTLAQLNFQSNHGFYNGQKMLFTDFNNSYSTFNNNEYYIKVINDLTLQFSSNSDLTDLIEFYDLKDPEISNATAVHETVADFNFASAHGLTQGMEVTAGLFNNSFTGLNGNNYFVKVIDSDTVQLATDSALTNLVRFYNGANGYLTAATPAKFGLNASLTLSANPGDIDTLSDGDVISFSNLIPSDHSWVSSLTGTLYAGNKSGSTFRVYSDQARTTEVAPYHLAASEDCTATVSGNVVITHSLAPDIYHNVRFVNGMPIEISEFDGSFGSDYNGQTLYVQNYNQSARTMNVSTDSAGNNLIYYAPNETDVDIDTVKIHSNDDISIKIPTRAIKWPDGTPVEMEDVFFRQNSDIVYAKTGTLNDMKNEVWVSDTRFLALENDKVNDADATIRFYDYSPSAGTITEDTGDAITLTKSKTSASVIVRTNKDASVIVAYEYDFNDFADRLWIITDSGSGYSSSVVDLQDDEADFMGFGAYQTSVSDDGLTIAIGNPYDNGTAPGGSSIYGSTSYTAGGFHVYSRTSLSNNFDFTSPDYEYNAPTSNKRYGYKITLSGDGNIIIAESWDGSQPKLFKLSSGTWSEDTTNTIPQVSSTYPDSITALNNDGTLFVGYYGPSLLSYINYRSDTSSTWSTVALPSGYEFVTDGPSTFADTTYFVASHYTLAQTSTPQVLKQLSLSAGTFSTPTNWHSDTPTTFTVQRGNLNDKDTKYIQAHNGRLYTRSVDVSSGNYIAVTDFATDDVFQIFEYLWQSNNSTYYTDFVATAGGKDEYLLYTDQALTTKASNSLNNLSAGDITMDENIGVLNTTAYEIEVAPTYTDSTDGHIDEEDNTPDNLISSKTFTSPTFGQGKNTFTESYTPAGPHEFYFAGSLTNASYGELVEVYTAPTPNIIVVKTPANATSGTLTISTSEDYRYRLNGVEMVYPGNTTYLQRTGASTYVGNAEIKQEYIDEGGDGEWSSFGHWPGGLTVSTDSSGYITGFSGFDSSQPGAFPYLGDKMFTVQKATDTYTPPSASTEAQEDEWDVDAQWDDTDLDFNTFTAADKTFPTTVAPSSVVVRTISPTATTSSQNGTKYSRTAGYTKYSIDVTYPAMSPEQYLDYSGFIATLNGQKHPFYFDIIQNGTQLVGRERSTIRDLRFKENVSTGDVTVLIEGFSSDQSDAIHRGELLIMGDSKHGNIKTAASTTDANVYGEAKFRLTTPMYSGRAISERLFNNPHHIIVSLDTDTVEVNRDTAGFYYLSLSFTADEWK